MVQIKDNIIIYYVTLTESLFKLTSGYDIMSKEENRIANSFIISKDKQRYIASHTLLRILLSRYIGIHHTKINFSKNTYGKPFISDSTMEFNLSHTKQKLVIAISNYEIGIDIEYLSESFDLNDFLDTALSNNEKEYIKALPETQQKRQFYSFWTKKEAFLKSIGTGLTNDLQMLELPIHKYDYVSNIYFKEHIITPLNNFSRGYVGHVAYKNTSEKFIEHEVLDNYHIKQIIKETI